MSRAEYREDNEGHFGLNYEAYTHFTSPIRRYPDLLVHRAIRGLLRSKKRIPHLKRADGATPMALTQSYPYDDAWMSAAGEHASFTERRADEATRDVETWLKCEYLLDKVGDEFTGVVTAVVGFGLFVELSDLYVEGLIHITGLPKDYYYHEAAHHRLIGERTKRVFRLGDTLRVRVSRVDLEERKVDFDLVETPKARKRLVVSPEAQRLAREHEENRSKGRRKDKTTSSSNQGKSSARGKPANNSSDGKSKKSRSNSKKRVKSSSSGRNKRSR
jgi:ribonuclease R